MYVAVNTLSELNTGDDPTFKGPVVIDGVSKSLSVVQTCTPFGCQKWHIQFIPSNCSEENLSFSSTPRHSISHYHTSLETPLQNAIQPKNSSSNVTAYFNPWIPKLPSASIDSGKKPLCVPDVCYPGEWLTSLPSCPDGKWAETDSAVGREGHISEMTDWFHFFFQIRASGAPLPSALCTYIPPMQEFYSLCHFNGKQTLEWRLKDHSD